MKTILSSAAALDRQFLETRCKIIEIAANLDRIDRGEGAAAARVDGRMAQVREAIGVLLSEGPDRAERCQMVFSERYVTGWPAPNKR